MTPEEQAAAAAEELKSLGMEDLDSLVDAQERVEAEEPEPVPEPEKPAPSEEEIKAQASAEGWRPRDEWRGDPAKWVDAAEFLKRGEVFVKKSELAKEVRELREARERHRQEVEEIKRSAQIFQEHLQKNQEAEFQRRLAEHRAAEIAALEEGDVRKALAARDRYDAEREAARPAPAKPPEPLPHPEFPAWKQENPWYDAEKDFDRWAEATGYGKELLATKRYTYRQMLDKVAERYRPKPEPRYREQPASVESPSPSRPASRDNGKSFAHLSADAKTNFREICRLGGAYKDTPEDREKFAKEIYARGEA